MAKPDDGMPHLPSKLDFGACENGRDPDARVAWRHFGELSIDEAFTKFCERPEIYQEDFMFMGGAAFAYYFPVIDRYVRESRVSDDPCDEVEAIWILAHCIKNQFSNHKRHDVKSLRPKLLALCAEVRGNLDHYCVDSERQKEIDTAWEELDIKLRSE
jgi:hypothetical protein